MARFGKPPDAVASGCSERNSTMQPWAASWRIFDTFKVPGAPKLTVPIWPDLSRWTDLASEAVAVEERRLRSLLDYWDDAFRDLGGDPSRTDWRKFRPLRLSREEDWSDWLCHLLETSTTGTFARELFGGRLRELVTDFAGPTAEREAWTDLHDRRGDLLIYWRDGAVSHVEVKIGDHNFEKTFETSNGLRRARGSPAVWVDHILILEAALDAWQERERFSEEDHRFDVLLWRDVARALRRGLLASEKTAWRAWGWTFTGAIEQRLLGLGYAEDTAAMPAPARLNRVLARIGILERGESS